ncbi:hypothetical protein BJY04DRAFT_229989 [Aspergillus karnatakaensis]|uniref:uncharacterized protein n=1 Tax=Aspergillus karnatakaensis TaxID=1810916 RepID=UPI003CCE0A9F
MIQSRLSPLPKTDTDAESEAEDLFTTFLPHLFPDEAPRFHGDPGECLLYASPRYGTLTIQLPSLPNKPSNESSLFAHFLWGAGLIIADAVEAAHSTHNDGETLSLQRWRVDGEKVLELGAGAALPSIICALAGAAEITITDHPASPALQGAIAHNVQQNIPSPIARSCRIAIQPHEWGNLAPDDNAWAASCKSHFTRIIAADCFWMSAQHGNLARTMKWFLAPRGRVWVVTGFHNGRGIVGEFFEAAREAGLEVENVYERDLGSEMGMGTGTGTGSGEVRREWVPVREGENRENRTRWCVVAVLKHAVS